MVHGDDAEPERADAGLYDAVDVSVKLAGAALSLTRKLTTDVAARTIAVGKDVVKGVREGEPPAELAGVILAGWTAGVRNILGIEQDLQQMGEQIGRVTRPVTSRLPEDVQPAIVELPRAGRRRPSVEEVRTDLRKQGQDLLYRSTAVDDPDEHPALAMILKELSPDEARIIRFIATTGPQAMVDVVARNVLSRKQREMVHHFSMLGREAGCIRPEKVPVYLDNLERLGILHVRPYRIRGQSNYELLYAQPELTGITKPRGKFVRLKTVHKGVELSEFGKELFCRCLQTERHRISDPPQTL